ncbi:MAG: OmpH family outer membrane protein [Bryobacteraceae bacterium]|nr:OmpH family outer membrane protein [Bryobacteraceae bacterium]
MRLGRVTAVVLCAAGFATAQVANPELVTQGGGSLTNAEVVFGGDGSWLAVRSASGQVRIYDLASGRVAREFSVDGNSALAAHPKEPLMAVAGETALSLRSIATGAVVWSVETGLRCQGPVFVEGGERVRAICQEAMGTTRKPAAPEIREWETATGSQVGVVKGIEDVQSISRLSGDGRYYIANKAPTGLLSSVGGFKSFVVETATGRKVAEVGFSPWSVVSGRHAVLMVMDMRGRSAGERVEWTLVDLETGKKTALPEDTLPAGGQILAAEGGRFVVLTMKGIALIDGPSGQIRRVDAADLPFPYGSGLSRNGKQMALVQGGMVVVLDPENPAERRTLGSGSEAVMTLESTARMAEAERQATRIETPKERGSVASRVFGIGRRQREEELQRRMEEQERQRNQQREDMNRAQAKEAFRAVSRFGGPVVTPPVPLLLEGGRFLAVRAADLAWDVWDVGTGDRLPFRQPFAIRDVMEMDQLDSGDQIVNGRDIALLEASVSGRPVAAPPVLRKGSGGACRSLLGGHVVELEWTGQKLGRAVWRRVADGQRVDLLAMGVPATAFAAPDPLVVRLGEIPECALSPDGRFLAVNPGAASVGKKKVSLFRRTKAEDLYVALASEEIVIYDVPGKREVSRLQKTAPGEPLPVRVGEVHFSYDGAWVAAGGFPEDGYARYGGRTPDERPIQIWETATGQKRTTLSQAKQRILGFAATGPFLLTATGMSQPGLDGPGVMAWDARTGERAFQVGDAKARSRLVTTTADVRVVLAPDAENRLGIWRRADGERLGSLQAFAEGEWLVTTPTGLFDGSPRGWTQIAWRTSDGALATSPGEAFFNEFYRPGLLAELLAGRAPAAPRTMQQVDRRQAVLGLAAEAAETGQRTVKVRVTVREAPAGVRDLRLFRNGSLVRVWRGDLDGQKEFEATVTLAAGENRLTAYAFNRDNVRSGDAVAMVRSTAAARQGVAYVVAVGVNEYANAEFNLKFAATDARRTVEVLTGSLTKLGRYREVVGVTLTDREATKEAMAWALARLGGKAQGAAPVRGLERLQAAEPEDLVVLSFAGHGFASGDRFHLVPHDLGYTGRRAEVGGELGALAGRSVSDLELERWFEPIDAGHLLFVIDACQAGQALESEEARRGPMNSKGLAQLAYEKGIHVLAAAQAYQAAIETEKLGHGYLTYALVEEGLNSAGADVKPADGEITGVEWFEHAARRVPQLQAQAGRLRLLTFQGERGQTPRVYYRRDGATPVVAKR